MNVYSVANQKGGPGKTSLVCHDGFYKAEMGQRVLMIDNDPQGNCSFSMEKSIDVTVAPFTTFDLYGEIDVSNFEPKSKITLVKATTELSKVARMNTDAALKFRDNVRKLEKHFDSALIDNGPTLGLSLVATLLTSDYVYSPIELADYSIAGLIKLMQTIEGIKMKANENLTYLGIIPNRLNSRDNSQKQKFADLLRKFPDKVIKAPIVERGSIREALSKGLPVWAIQKEVSAARKATKEVVAALEFINNTGGK